MFYEKLINCICFGYIGDVYLIVGYNIDNYIFYVLYININLLII